MLDDNLKQHCKEVHKVSERSKRADAQYDLRRTSKEKKVNAIMEKI